MEVIRVGRRLLFSSWKDGNKGKGLVVERSISSFVMNIESVVERVLALVVALENRVSQLDWVGTDFLNTNRSFFNSFANREYPFIAS